ncbi:MAG: hypothetical protein K6F46_12195 [Desulfovibrio sp.]|nr:hypothetical protein [Desulfovibrio sp.]
MNPQKNQPVESNELLHDLEGEVSEESAPLLRFIMEHGGKIATAVIIFLMVVGVSAVWNWYQGKQKAEVQQQLSAIMIGKKGAERIAPLKTLAESAPGSMRLAVYMTLGQTALEEGDNQTAAEAFDKAAKEDADGVMGMMASLSKATAMLKAGKSTEAMNIVTSVQARLPENDRPAFLQKMLADAALLAGQKDLAAKTYAAMADAAKGPEADFWRSRAEALGADSKPAAEQPK